MQSNEFIFTSESVTEGHPDKVCDQVSDSILDAFLEKDPNSRVAIETMVGKNFVHIAGEATSNVDIDFRHIAKKKITDIGYVSSDLGLNAIDCTYYLDVHKQSEDIALGVNEGSGLFSEQGAGDQGLMFGYASNETDAFMPAPIHYAHLLTQNLAKLRHDKTLEYLRPDGKCQVSIRYKDNAPYSIDTVVLSTQHDADVSQETIRADAIEKIIKPCLPDNLLTKQTQYLINPTGRFVTGGPEGDCGLTGRKIIVDTYGGWGRHGGGAFSGKDASKVDRSAAYMARFIAKNIVAAQLAKKCEVQIAYAIGVSEPVSVMVNTFNSSDFDEQDLSKAIRAIFPLKPKAIVEELKLSQPIFSKTAAYGHFGRNDQDFSWERLSKVQDLHSHFKL